VSHDHRPGNHAYACIAPVSAAGCEDDVADGTGGGTDGVPGPSPGARDVVGSGANDGNGEDAVAGATGVGDVARALEAQGSSSTNAIAAAAARTLVGDTRPR